MAEFLDRLIPYDDKAGVYRYDWDEILKVPEFAKLAECSQPKKWHSEGDVLEHTKAVCRVMAEDVIRNDMFGCLSHYDIIYMGKTKGKRHYMRLLMTAALFHDIGKGVSTVYKNGEWHAYGHEFEGEHITRLLLWDEGWEFREAVCALVRRHMDVLRIFDLKDPYFRALVLSKEVSMNALLCLKYADCFGSTPEDLDLREIDRMKISELAHVCNALGCMWGPANVVTNGKYKWRRLSNMKKLLKSKESPEVSLTVLIGIPGAGKDTFLKRMDIENAVVLCRDDIRVELGYCRHGEKIIGTALQENEVSKVFNRRMLDAAEAGKHIIVNNMNTKAKYRKAYGDLLAGYDLTVNYIYIENCKLDEVITRRDGQIPAAQYKNIIMSFDWPAPDEYDRFSVNSVL